MFAELLQTLHDNTVLAVGAATALSTIGGGAVKLYLVVSRGVRQVEALQGLPARMDALDQSMSRVLSQVYPNGGSSLYDQVQSFKGYKRAALNLQERPAIEFDSAGQCVFVNRAWVLLTGRSSEDCAGNGWANIVCSDYRKDMLMQWQEAVKTGSHFEYTTTLGSGKQERDGSFYFSFCGSGWIGTFDEI